MLFLETRFHLTARPPLAFELRDLTCDLFAAAAAQMQRANPLEFALNVRLAPLMRGNEKPVKALIPERKRDSVPALMPEQRREARDDAAKLVGVSPSIR